MSATTGQRLDTELGITYAGSAADSVFRVDLSPINWQILMLLGLQGIQSAQTKGSASQRAGQVATSTTAAASIAARATRRGLTVRNIDAAIIIYIGHDNTVSSTTGMPLNPGESIPIDTAAAIWTKAASGTPRIAYVETYD